jgi:hypothetical protein
MLVLLGACVLGIIGIIGAAVVSIMDSFRHPFN